MTNNLTKICAAKRIAVAIAQKIGVVETAADFLNRRAGMAQAKDMLPFLEKAKREVPPIGDAL